MPYYSEEYKEKLVVEMMSPNGRSISEIHRATGISENSLYSWKNRYGGVEGESEEVRKPKPENWDGERKLLALIETAGLNKQEMSEYCRENGLYVEQMERWKEFAIAGTESGTLLTRGQRQEWQRDKNGYPWRRMGKRLFASRAEPSAKSGPIFILSTARYENEMLH